jgi:hypothetical protein
LYSGAGIRERGEIHSSSSHKHPNRLLTLLKVTSLAAAMNALVRVKSYYPDVDMAKVKASPDAEQDHGALELEVREAALEVAHSLYYEGDDDEQ